MSDYESPSIAPIERPRVRYFGPFAKPTGYAQAGHDYLAALHRAGVELDIWLQMEADTRDLPERYHHLLPFAGRDRMPPTHVVVHTIPKHAAHVVLPEAKVPPGVPAILLTTWETSRIGADVADDLNENFDLVIVPSDFNAHAFRESGVERVAVVPHCFDPAAWPMAEPRPAKPFVFYTIGVWGERKNLMGLLKAYLSAFTSGDDVLLRVVTPFVVEDEIQHLCERMGLADLPRLEFVGVGRRLSETDLLAVHQSSHCYVSATRGEAWGLGAFEAAILGKPVIMPGFGGQTQFLPYAPWIEVPHFKTPAIGQDFQAAMPLEIAGMRFVPMTAGVPNGIAADQHWAEPDLASLQQAMRAAYRGKDSGGRSFPRADELVRSTLEREFGYETVAARFIAALHTATGIRRAMEDAVLEGESVASAAAAEL